MAEINKNYLDLKEGYLFSNINKRVNAYLAKNPNAPIIRLGIGDVTLPLAKAVVDAMEKAVKEMGVKETFRGYPPERGYDFLIEAIKNNDYKGLDIKSDEIFVSDGAKSDTGNIAEIFGNDNIVAVCDPVYPVYVDSNVMQGRSGKMLENGSYENFVYLPCLPQNNFTPKPTKELKADLIYLCYPNNPTGAVATKDDLKEWVDYANENNSVILFDSAYEAFIREDNIPHSIYEIEGAKSCAIEFRSFSKTAGFTGVRCGFAVVPKELKVGNVEVNKLWARRQSTKFNGVSYITQRGAEAVYSKEGKEQVKKVIDYYLNNASVIFNGLKKAGYEVYGAKNSPYVWVKTPNNMKSWEFFDYLLKKKNIVGTPGEGFGKMGEGYLRLTAFNTLEKSIEALERILKDGE